MRPDAILLDLATARPPNVIKEIRESYPAAQIRMLKIGRRRQTANFFENLFDAGEASIFSWAAGLRSVLTPRERQVVHFIERGMTNNEIGNALSIAECTVKSHVHAILQKLELSHRGQIAPFLNPETGLNQSGKDLDPSI
jgi:DNA-binding NarL/FixJ family response regulator